MVKSQCTFPTWIIAHDIFLNDKRKFTFHQKKRQRQDEIEKSLIRRFSLFSLLSIYSICKVCLLRCVVQWKIWRKGIFIFRPPSCTFNITAHLNNTTFFFFIPNQLLFLTTNSICNKGKLRKSKSLKSHVCHHWNLFTCAPYNTTSNIEFMILAQHIFSKLKEKNCVTFFIFQNIFTTVTFWILNSRFVSPAMTWKFDYWHSSWKVWIIWIL